MPASLNPQRISQTDWYYENSPRGYFTFVHEVKDQDGDHLKTDQFRVPMRRLRASLSRCIRSDAVLSSQNTGGK
jgi:hypothetical protein